MSYTTVYKVPAQGGIESAGEFRNAHGYGPYVYNKMGSHRLGWGEHEWILKKGADIKPLWRLAEDESLPNFERITLTATYDRVMVRRENIPRVIEAFRAFVAAYPPGKYACSLLAQADLLEDLAQDPECFAVCWNGTSVSDNWPFIYEECPHCGNDTEEYREYDVSLDSDHWFMFDELKGISE